MNYMISRRQMLQGMAALGIAGQGQAVPFLQRTSSKKEEPARSIVLIYLRGGADFLNMIIPRNDPSYQLSRPGIGIPDGALVPLEKNWGLHPGLKELQPLYEQKLFTPIVCVGSPHPTRSHFDAQDFMNFAAPGSRTVRSGWLNRYLSATTPEDAEAGGDFRAIGMQRLLPTAIRGEYPVLAVPDGFNSRRSSSVLDQFEKFYGAGSEGRPTDEDGMGSRREDQDEVNVLESGKVTIDTLRRFKELLANTESSDHGYPNGSFGQGMKRIAQVLLSGEELQVAALDLGGWDHHAGQGAATGAQFNLLRQLGGGIAAFRRHLGPAFENTMVMVMTEFGRTVRENGSGGTDHGHGSGMLLLGGGLRGGDVYGEWRGLRTAQLYQGRDLAVTTDFRDVFSTVLREHMGFKASKDFFPDYRPKSLRLFA